MSVKKLSFYLDLARITVRSDHLPLKRFLEKNTLNAKVNNCAVELELQKIDFVFIQGTKNMLADTLLRLIEIDDNIKLPAEQEGHEFGECLLILAHDEQGHNGFKRTQSALKTLYYWKGMKRHIQLYCRRCRTCARHNVQTQVLQKEHFSAPPQPMEFIAMDLIGEFHPASSKGNSVMDASKDSTGSSKHVLENNFNKDLNGMILFGKPQQPTTFSPQSLQVSHHSFSCMDMKQMPNT